MSKHISFTLFDDNGNPLEEASPTFVIFCRSVGASLTPPVITEKGDGFYEFMTDTEVTGPIAYLINAGPGSSIRYLAGSVGEFIAFVMYDEFGNPDASRTPSFYSYTNGGDEPPTPDIVNLTGGLFGFWPEVPAGYVHYYNVGDSINMYSGTIGSCALVNPVPAAETEIVSTQSLSFDVIDSETELGRVLIAIKYAAFNGATELVWDGQTVCGPFQISSIPITNGRRYTVSRIGGWPSAPTVRVFLTNYGGREL